MRTLAVLALLFMLSIAYAKLGSKWSFWGNHDNDEVDLKKLIDEYKKNQTAKVNFTMIENMHLTVYEEQYAFSTFDGRLNVTYTPDNKIIFSFPDLSSSTTYPKKHNPE